ncbi:MAG: LysM peptidoglycan-binding domain-containing protein [Candidatus Electrothrix sp. AW3_4]|nr:LysM peptidoglycan-binding domain-containing protein [Candidatus Electrothrix gigas]
MKVSLIVPLVSFPFFTACTPLLYNLVPGPVTPDSLMGIRQEKVTSSPLLVKNRRNLPQAEVREVGKKKKGMQQTRAVYSSELVFMKKKNIYTKEVQAVKTVQTRPLSLAKIKKPVSEQEPEHKLQEEVTALKETGDWRSRRKRSKRSKRSKIDGARQSLLTSASFSSFFSDEIQPFESALTLPNSSSSFTPVQFTIDKISAQISKKNHENIYREVPTLSTSVQFEQEPEQELQEEITALQATGDWRRWTRGKNSKIGKSKQSLLTSASFSSFFSDEIHEIQSSESSLTFPNFPNFLAPVQLNEAIDFISLLAKNPTKEQTQDISLGTKTLISDFPIIVNKQVAFYLDKFQHEQREIFEAWLERSALYVPLIEQELNKAALPKALIRLAMIESGFNPSAYSPAGATGLWQFMPTTAKSYGLRIDSWIDERRNPEKATKAAISYLSALYKQFGDWQLAVAAYNAGEGKISRGLEKYKVKNFWELAEKNYLPLETKRYVPKLIAAIIIAHEPKRYGFQPVAEKKMEYDVVDVPSRTPLAKVAKAGGYSVKEIRQLNNELLKNQIPPVQNMYSLRVPAGSSTRIAANIAENLQETRSDKKKKVIHRLQRGETLSGVSKRYNVPVNMIMQWNDIDDVRRLQTGRKLALYPHKKFHAGKDQVVKMDISYYKVRHGDSLWSIAQKHQVSTREIKQWNQLNNNLLHPGKKLVIKKS